MYDIIIIGAGPAGLTAAIYACRANKNVLVLEAKSYGGQIVNASNIENYPGISNISGFDFATNLYNQAKSFGCEIKFETVLSIDDNYNVNTNKSSYKGKSIIIATGTENRKINLPLEEKFIGRGISYCATCDGNFYKDKNVAVVGGGNTAIDDCIYLSNIVKKVYLIHRRDEFRAEERIVQELREKENVEFILNSVVSRLNGDENLESIDVTSNDGDTRKIEVDGLFIAIGQAPKSDIFKNIIDIDSNGYIISSDGVHTSKDMIYVAGDARVKDLRQLTTAISDGAIVSDMIIKNS